MLMMLSALSDREFPALMRKVQQFDVSSMQTERMYLSPSRLCDLTTTSFLNKGVKPQIALLFSRNVPSGG